MVEKAKDAGAWERVVHVIREINPAHEVKVCKDGNITSDEFRYVLDLDKNGATDYRDFKFDSALFGDVKSVIKQYFPDIYEDIWFNWNEHDSVSLVPSPFLSDRDFMLARTREYAYNFDCVDPELAKDFEIALAAVRQKEWLLNRVDKTLGENPDFLLAAIRENRRILEYVGKVFVKNREFTLKAAEQNVNVLQYKIIDTETKKLAWSNLVSQVKDWQNYFNREEMNSFDSFVEALRKKYDISFIERFRSLNSIFEVLRNRGTGVVKDQKTCIMIYPVTEYGEDAFDKYPVADKMIELGYKIIYYETRFDWEARNYLYFATKGGENRADVVIFAGHGYKFGALSLKLPEIYIEGLYMQSYIDNDDFKSMDRLDLARYVKDDGDIIYYSCWAGLGGSPHSDNLVNATASTLSRGMKVQGPTVDSNIYNIALDSAGRPKIEFFKGKNYTANGVFSILR